jgi:hypothetical protein
MKTPKKTIQAIAQIRAKLLNERVDCSFSIFPCVKGREETGNVVTVFDWKGDNSIKHAALQQKRYYSTDAMKVVLYYRKHIKPELKRINNYIRILSLYRESGLIPKRVARRHKDILKKSFLAAGVQMKRTDHYYRLTKEGYNHLAKLSGNYISRWAKCPKCGKTGFEESILGWNCENCNAVWEDSDPRDCKWS